MKAAAVADSSKSCRVKIARQLIAIWSNGQEEDSRMGWTVGSGSHKARSIIVDVVVAVDLSFSYFAQINTKSRRTANKSCD